MGNVPYIYHCPKCKLTIKILEPIKDRKPKFHAHYEKGKVTAYEMQAISLEDLEKK